MPIPMELGTGPYVANGDIGKHIVHCESLQQQKARLHGWPFNDAAVTVPIKKRRRQMLEVCSSSPLPSSASPATVAHFPLSTNKNSPAPENAALMMPLLESNHNGEARSFRECTSFGGPIEKAFSSEDFQPELAVIGLSQMGGFENQVLTDLKLINQMQLAKDDEEHTKKPLDRHVVESSQSKASCIAMPVLKLESQIQRAETLSSTGPPQKKEFLVNDIGDREDVLLKWGIQESVQTAERSFSGVYDKRESPLKRNSFHDHDDRFHWDLNMEMEAWEQTTDEQLPLDSSGDVKDKLSDCDFSLYQSLSRERKASIESTPDVISMDNGGIDYDGQFGEGDNAGPAFIAESFEYDACVADKQLDFSTKKHLMESREAEEARNRQHQALSGHAWNDVEAKHYVDFGDSDCRFADDTCLEDEKLSLVLQAASDFNLKELHKVHVLNKQFSLDLNDPNLHCPRESHCTASSEMKEDGELSHVEVDSRELHESAGNSGEYLQEFESKRIMTVDESNICSKDASGKSELLHEVDNNQQTPTSKSQLQKQSAAVRTKVRDWDFTKRADSLQAALRAAEESLMMRKGCVSDRGTTTTSVSKSYSPYIDRARCDQYVTHRREASSNYHRRFEEGSNCRLRPVSSRESIHGRKFGSSGGVTVEAWIDGPHSKWRRGHYPSRPTCRSLRTSINAAALAVAKVESSGFIVTPDGTLIKARTTASAKRSGMQAFKVSERHEMVMNGGRRLSLDDDTGTEFRRMVKPFHHSAGSASKPTRQILSPPRHKEHRSRDKDSAGSLRDVRPSKRGCFVQGPVACEISQVVTGAQQSLPTRMIESKQMGEQQCSSTERSKHNHSDIRKLKVAEEDAGSFSGSYHIASPGAGISSSQVSEKALEKTI